MVTWRTGISCQLLGASAATTHHSCYHLHSGMIQASTDSCENVPEIFGIPSLIVSHGSIFRREIPTRETRFPRKVTHFWSRTWQGTKQACWGWNSSCLSKRKKDEKWKLYFTTFWHILTGHVWGLWSWSMGEYSLVFENRRRGRPPALICHPSPVSQVTYHDVVIVIQSVIFPYRPVEFTYSYQIDDEITTMVMII